MTFIDTIAYAAVGLNIVGYSMRRMIPLRIAAIATNVLFIVYSVMAGIHPTLYLHAILLPLNAYRLREMLRLVRDVELAAKGNLFVRLAQAVHSYAGLQERRCCLS